MIMNIQENKKWMKKGRARAMKARIKKRYWNWVRGSKEE